MSQARIRHRYKGRVYFSPVLLDHRSLKWLWLSVFLLLTVVFLAGYISGFEKAEYRWVVRVDSLPLVLPAVAVVDQASLEAQPPAVEEPGASIDVDSVDVIAENNIIAEITAQVQVIDEVLVEEKTEIAELVEPAVVVAEKINEQITAGDFKTEVQVSAIGGPLINDFADDLSISDNASEEAASHSIQVGMYKSFDNAASKVEKLLHSDLSAYLHEYQNKNNETRYKVRFGYFNSFSSAGLALENFEKKYSGSGYVVRLD